MPPDFNEIILASTALLATKEDLAHHLCMIVLKAIKTGDDITVTCSILQLKTW